MSAGYENAIRDALPDAEVLLRPFHVVKLANEAVNEVRRAAWNDHGKSTTASGKWIKGVRWALVKVPERHSARQAAKLARSKSRVCCCRVTACGAGFGPQQARGS